MRTNLLILATVASLFASCIQSECLSVEDTEIGFNAQVGAPTKSMFFGNDFSSSAMFDVWGIGIVLCSETSKDIARYSILKGNEQLFAAKYLPLLPSEEDLKREIEKQKEIFNLQHNIEKE